MSKGKELEYNEVQAVRDLQLAWKKHMPTELTGPVEYGVMKHGFGGGVNPGLGSSLDSMAYGKPHEGTISFYIITRVLRSSSSKQRPRRSR